MPVVTPARSTRTHLIFLTINRPALLSVVPPYSTMGPPAAPAYLLSYLGSHGVGDFAFLDLRLGVSDAYAPTYTSIGSSGQSYVMDIPDLPLVLALLRATGAGRPPLTYFDDALHEYCQERAISPRYLADYLACLDRYLKRASERLSGIKFVACSVWTSNYLSTLMFAAHLKNLKIAPTVVIGGPQPSESRAATALALKSALVDRVVIGEGEATFLELYQRFCKGDLHSSVAGTAHLNVLGEVEYGPVRGLLPEREIPIPSFDQVPLALYDQFGKRSLPLHLSRGCTDKCAFCSEWKFWQKFRPGDSLSSFNGVQDLHEKYYAEHIAFSDSLLNGHLPRLMDLAERIIRYNKSLSWSGFMRANIDSQTATLLRRSGCESVFVGIESMSDTTLVQMNKRRTEIQNAAALEALLGAGIHVVAGFIPGFPGDASDAFAHTAKRLRQMQERFPGRLRINVEPFVVSPGQPIYGRLSEFGLKGHPWPEATLELAPAYRNISSTVLEAVTGDNQGIERLARLRIAESLQSDDPVRTDPFDYKGVEYLSRMAFNFEFLTAGWFLGRLKGPDAWVYSIIVNEREREHLESMEFLHRWTDVLEAPLSAKFIQDIENRHVIRPKREPELILENHRSRSSDRAAFVLSPTTVCRQGDWRIKYRTIAVESRTTQWILLSKTDFAVVRKLANPDRYLDTPLDAASDAMKLAALPRIRKILEDMFKLGLILRQELPRTFATSEAGTEWLNRQH